MPNAFRMSGTGARVCWGYRTVAELGAWTIEEGALVAHDARVLNPIWITQRDLTLIIPRGDGRAPWVRPLANVVVEQSTLYAQLLRNIAEVTT